MQNHALPLVTLADTLHTVIATIDEGRKGIALVVDDQGRLTGTITDGDIRRSLLGRARLERTVGELQQERGGQSPIVAPLGTDPDILRDLMTRHEVQQIPLLDEAGRPVELVTLSELQSDSPTVQALIMAGGFGTRLRPLTDSTPKPMLAVGDRPLLEHVVDQLRDAGIYQVNISTFYRPEKIVQHFGDGSDFGVRIRYVREDQPLGTAGALSLLENRHEPVLMLNGDVLTGVDFKALVAYHRKHRSVLTMAVRKYEVTVPFGVVEHEGTRVHGLTEKPTFELFVNAGIYLIEPKALALVPDNERLDMPELIQKLLDQGETVASFPIHEYWLDIGRHEDYTKAQQDVASGKIRRRAA